MESVVDKSTDRPLTARPAWKSLQGHFQRIREQHLRQLFAADTERGKRMTAEAEGIFLDYSKNRVTDETLQLLLKLAEESNLLADRRNVSRRQDQRYREARGAARRAAGAPRNLHRGGWRERGSRSSCRAGQNDGFLQSRPQRRVEGVYRQTHSQRHQRWHRRLRPWTCHGLRSVEALQRPRPDLSIRLQCG